MTLYRITPTHLEPLTLAPLADNGIRERQDLQRLLRQSIETIAPDTLVLAEEFSAWEDSRRRIDLLCLDREARLVVVELKRDDDGGHMDLQAIRYAAMVSPMTFDDAVRAYAQHLGKAGENPEQAQQRLLDFLRWEHPQAETFPADVRIVLAAADFSVEITTAVLWLIERGLDIRCVRLAPHRLDDQILLNVEQCLPLPQAEAYQVRLCQQAQQQREARRQQGSGTGYWFMNVGDEGGAHAHRSWEDCRRNGFMLAGGGESWIRQLQRLQPGNRIFAYVSGAGYVGLGRVTAVAVPQRDFVTADGRRYTDLSLTTPPDPKVLDDLDRCDWCVAVEWLKTVDRDQAVLSQFAYRNTVCQICQQHVVDDLLTRFDAANTAG
ncbi:MAG: hypothetical protein IT443_06590 [Phycisphaeraceae bacterium]|nr:hypothetical protein [Phycisphaeraceae bacterium]